MSRRLRMVLSLEPTAAVPPVPSPLTIRPVREDDREGLAVLMLEAYRGTVDDEGEDLGGAREEVRRTFDGQYGRFLPGSSVVTEDERGLVGATLVTMWEGLPLVAFTMTRPDMKGRGVATALMTRSLDLLRDAGHDSVQLVVTEGNDSAIRLYERLGFRATSPPA